MKLLAVALISLLHLVSAMEIPAPNADEIDPLENIGEEEFEEDFGLPPVTDLEEKARREEALKENEELIKEENELYSEGNRTWFDGVNEFADLPADEFEAQKTGEVEPAGFARGLIEPTGGFLFWNISLHGRTIGSNFLCYHHLLKVWTE